MKLPLSFPPYKLSRIVQTVIYLSISYHESQLLKRNMRRLSLVITPLKEELRVRHLHFRAGVNTLALY
jgi:predicted nucleic acid-binding protein